MDYKLKTFPNWKTLKNLSIHVLEKNKEEIERFKKLSFSTEMQIKKQDRV